MQLLRAELSKLNRPLTWGVLTASVLFTVLLAIAGSSNAANALKGSGRVPSCAEVAQQAPGASCPRVQAQLRANAPREHAEQLRLSRQVTRQLSVPGAGAEAAGLMASLPGVLALALLAGGHVGGEWSGRTLKQMLLQCGQRHNVLVAKLLSLWLAGVGLMLACWAALAAIGPAVAELDRLPASTSSIAATISWAGSQFARSLLVLGFFAAISLLAAVVTRSTIGTTATTTGVALAMLLATELPGLGKWTPATWVQGWMGFGRGQTSITALPNNYWSRFLPSSGAPPGHLVGAVGLVAAIATCTLLAMRTFARSDVTG